MKAIRLKFATSRLVYFASCLGFVSVFIVFLVYMGGQVSRVELSIDMDVPVDGRIELFWAVDGKHEARDVSKQKVFKDRALYTFVLPFTPEKVLLRIDPIDRKKDVRIRAISLSHPGYHSYTVDLNNISQKRRNYGHLSIIPDEGGSVLLKAEDDNPWIALNIDMQKRMLFGSLVWIAVVVYSLLMWFVFHPTLIKGKKKAGFLVLEMKTDKTAFLDELESIFTSLQLEKSVYNGDFTYLYYSFSKVDQKGVSQRMSQGVHSGDLASYRIQFNRSGEV